MSKPANYGVTAKMQQKLAVLFIVVLLAFMLLSVRIFAISRDNGDRYKRQVLSQQEYDSIVLPAKRGEIIDRNGTKLAVSQKVYNVCIDSNKLNSEDGKYLNDTMRALFSTSIEFRYTEQEVRNYINENPGSKYKIVAKKQSYDVVSDLMSAINDKEKYPNLQGVWLEDDYMRTYPYNSLACDVIGFVQGDNMGAYGLEGHYDNTLKGTNGREYGYLNDDENVERTVKSAVDGRTLRTSLDVNIQSIVEKHILAFNKEHENEAREGNGSNNTGVIIMRPNTGEVLAMASYPVFDLNNPRDESTIKIEMPDMSTFYNNEETPDEETSENAENTDNNSENQNAGNINETAENNSENNYNNSYNNLSNNNEDANGNSLNIKSAQDNEIKTNGETYEEAYEKAKTEAFAALWKNFCINSTYEPGSTMKPFTMALGLEEGVLTGNETYTCNGVMEVGGHPIHCNNRLGHGVLDFSGALEQSCNVALMKIAQTEGKTLFMEYNKIFNFGLKTNIDLTGEAMTNTLVFDENNMRAADLAIGSFGQGFNVTMIQMIAGYCSLINGGKYYQPHLVTEIIDANGATVEKIEPRILKQTISEETSKKIREMCVNVVSKGTGKSARPAGYMIGGKTGTAQTLPRGNKQYIVSFIGFAPADNPEIAIYTVIDRPNVGNQAVAKYATVLTRDILTEVLPYLNIPKTEELSEAEIEELKEKQIEFATSSTGKENKDEENADDNGENSEGGENSTDENSSDSVIQFVDENGNPIENPDNANSELNMPEVVIDEATGYAIDPTTGAFLDPTTGELIDTSISDLPD